MCLMISFTASSQKNADLHRVWPLVDDVPVEDQNIRAMLKLTLSEQSFQLVWATVYIANNNQPARAELSGRQLSMDQIWQGVTCVQKFTYDSRFRLRP